MGKFMKFDKEYDFTGTNIKRFRVVCEFNNLKPYFAYVEILVGEDKDYIYTRARLLGYVKDENMHDFVNTGLNLFGDTRYKHDVSLDKFFDIIQHNSELLNDTLDTLDYLIIKHIDKIKEENRLWEK